MGLWDEWGVFQTFSLVAVTSTLVTTIRVGGTIRRKNNFLFSGVTEEVVATITVGTPICLVNP